MDANVKTERFINYIVLKAIYNSQQTLIPCRPTYRYDMRITMKASEFHLTQHTSILRWNKHWHMHRRADLSSAFLRTRLTSCFRLICACPRKPWRLERVAKNNKGFYRYMDHKRKNKEDVPPLINEKGELVTIDMKKAKVLRFFASVCNGSQTFHLSRVPEPFGRGWGSTVPSTVSKEPF